MKRFYVETFENRKPKFHVWFGYTGIQIRIFRFGLDIGFR